MANFFILLSGLYCSGWVKHGPVGVIVTTMNEAFATAEKIVEDLHLGNVNNGMSSSTSSDVENVFRAKGKFFVVVGINEVCFFYSLHWLLLCYDICCIYDMCAGSNKVKFLSVVKSV